MNKFPRGTGKLDTVDTVVAYRTPTSVPPRSWRMGSFTSLPESTTDSPVFGPLSESQSSAGANWYPINKAIVARDIETLRALLADARFLDLNWRGPGPGDRRYTRNTPLHRAVALGDAAACEALLSAGADPNHDNNKYLVTYATQTNSIDTVRLLLEAGADANSGQHVQKWQPGTSLYWAVQNAREDIFTMLLEHGVNINKGLIKWPPLYAAFTREPRGNRNWDEEYDITPVAVGARRRLGFKLLRAGARICWHKHYWDEDFSPRDYTMLKSFADAGGFNEFEAARVEAAVLMGLMSRGGKLPDELICVAVEFLGLKLPRWKPVPKGQ